MTFCAANPGVAPAEGVRDYALQAASDFAFQRLEDGSPMTWAEAFRRGRNGWLVWIVAGALLGCGFLIKGGTKPEFLWALGIGAANGAAVGFAFGPAAEKRAMILSGLFAGTPFYFIACSMFLLEIVDARSQTSRPRAGYDADRLKLPPSWSCILIRSGYPAAPTPQPPCRSQPLGTTKPIPAGALSAAFLKCICKLRFQQFKIFRHGL